MELSGRYTELFDEMVEQVLPDQPGESAVFWPLLGREYKRRGLLLVGRAVNGWHVPDPDATTSVSTGARQYSASHTETSWPSRVGADERYNPNRSQFWMAAREVLARLQIAEPADAWSEKLAWSNLYKIAPASGNPGDRLCSVQLASCRALLKREIEELEPARVLLFTGWNWASDVVDELPVTWAVHDTDSRYVDQTGKGMNASWVVARHPQGKPREALVEEVVRGFRDSG